MLFFFNQLFYIELTLFYLQDYIILGSISYHDAVNQGSRQLWKNLGNEVTTTTSAGKFAYRREDGIYVVPIGCLKD